MAGEFEDPIGISFQADALQSGSVSFGRFEKEELAWERRSSFSHNRYLEEVEKYSKPGSVVKKKAYFEAHFKKKGTLLPDTLGLQYVRNNSSSLESGDHEEDDDDQVTGAGYDCFSSAVAPANNGGFWSDSEGGPLFQSSTDSNHSGRCDEAECEVVGSEKVGDPAEASLEGDDHGSVEGVVEDLQRTEACQSMRDDDDKAEAVVGDQDYDENGDQVPVVGSDGYSDTAVAAMHGGLCSVNEGGNQFQSSTGSNHSVRYDECEVVGSGKDGDQVEASVEDDAHSSVEPISGVIQQAEARRSKQDQLCDDRQEEEDAAELPRNNAASQNQSSRTTGQSAKRRNAQAKVGRLSASQQPHVSQKTRAATERPPSKFTSKSHGNASQTSKVSGKIQNRKERDQTLEGIKVQKQLPERSLPAKSPLLRVPQKEQSAKRISGSSSMENGENVAKLKKDSVSQLSGQKETNTKLYQSQNSHKQIASSNNPSTKPNPPRYNLKSEERAERRKQFYSKLEEKLHAKEAEMNQIQARTQEKTEAEMKRFRQSINFKATPMPSFYHHSTQQIRSGNKAVTSNPRLAKEQNKSSIQGNRNAKSKSPHKAANKSVAARDSAKPKTDDQPALQMTSEATEPSGRGACKTSLAGDDRIEEATRSIGSKGKAGPENTNDHSS